MSLETVRPPTGVNPPRSNRPTTCPTTSPGYATGWRQGSACQASALKCWTDCYHQASCELWDGACNRDADRHVRATPEPPEHNQPLGALLRTLFLGRAAEAPAKFSNSPQTLNTRKLLRNHLTSTPRRNLKNYHASAVGLGTFWPNFRHCLPDSAQCCPDLDKRGPSLAQSG